MYSNDPNNSNLASPPAHHVYFGQKGFWGKKSKRYLRRLPEYISLPFKLPKLAVLDSAGLQPIFVAGLAGSGTTLIMQLIYQNFENACALDETGLMIPKRTGLRVKPINYHLTVENYLQSLKIPSNIDPAKLAKSITRYYLMNIPYCCKNKTVLDKAPNVHLARAAFLAQAFPGSRFVLVVRGPFEVVAGLRRKWRLFRREPLLSSINFYKALYFKFLDESLPFRDRVLFVSYDKVLENSENFINSVEQKIGLYRRSRPKKLSDKKYIKGKGVHNIVGGNIVIDRNTKTKYKDLLSSDDYHQIEHHLMGLYTSMKDLC